MLRCTQQLSRRFLAGRSGSNWPELPAEATACASTSGWLQKFSNDCFAAVWHVLVGKVLAPYGYKILGRNTWAGTMYVLSDGEISETIRWYLKSGGGGRVGDLCHLLGLAMRSNACVARFMRELGVPNSR